jgi:4-hydroxy-tetrahydrodipicolinate reductase
MHGVTRLAVIGDGKMGRAVAQLAESHGFEVVALLGESQVAPQGLSRAMLDNADVVIEFTVPASAATNVRQCIALGFPVVCGTTGWDEERVALEREVAASGTGALLWAPNFSLGVHVFARIVEHAARLIASANAGFDAAQIETHHAAKLDAPSGTARLLAQHVARGLGHEIPTTSVRTGSVPGTHEILFDAPFEQISLTHVARDRRVFAAGALTAARWLVGPPRRRGVFTLDHLLGTTE